MHFDTILRGAELIDGMGSERFEADLGVTGARIVAIGDLRDSTAAHVIDVDGHIVAPGFIDSHTHDDAMF